MAPSGGLKLGWRGTEEGGGSACACSDDVTNTSAVAVPEGTALNGQYRSGAEVVRSVQKNLRAPPTMVYPGEGDACDICDAFPSGREAHISLPLPPAMPACPTPVAISPPGASPHDPPPCFAPTAIRLYRLSGGAERRSIASPPVADDGGMARWWWGLAADCRLDEGGPGVWPGIFIPGAHVPAWPVPWLPLGTP